MLLSRVAQLGAGGTKGERQMAARMDCARAQNPHPYPSTSEGIFDEARNERLFLLFDGESRDNG